jgi:hypothetical protein
MWFPSLYLSICLTSIIVVEAHITVVQHVTRQLHLRRGRVRLGTRGLAQQLL